MHASPEFFLKMPVLQVSNHPRPLTIKWRVPFDAPIHEVSGDHLAGFGLFDRGIQTIAFLFSLHILESSDFYHNQEDPLESAVSYPLLDRVSHAFRLNETDCILSRYRIVEHFFHTIFQPPYFLLSYTLESHRPIAFS